MRVDISFLPALATAFLLTFARVGAMVMLLPGVGELSVPSRVRLTIALVLTAILLPAHQKAYVVDLKTFGPVLVLLFQELVVGAVLGLTARLASRARRIVTADAPDAGLLYWLATVDPAWIAASAAGDRRDDGHFCRLSPGCSCRSCTRRLSGNTHGGRL